MLLIPGLSCDGTVWESTVDHFKGHYECHIFSLAGFAGRPAIPAPMLETVRKELASYIREKKLNHPVVVGHSLGGFMAWWLGASEPDLVGPIVAVDGGTFLPALMMGAGATATVEAIKPQAEMMRTMLANASPEAFMQQNKMFLKATITSSNDLERLAPICGKSDPKATGEAMYEMMTTDLREPVAHIKTPCLLVAAGVEAKTPEEKKELLARYDEQVAKVPNHKVILAEHSKHFIMFDEPSFLFAQMEAFLKH